MKKDSSKRADSEAQNRKIAENNNPEVDGKKKQPKVPFIGSKE